MKNPFLLLVLIVSGAILWIFNQPLKIENNQDSE